MQCHSAERSKALNPRQLDFNGKALQTGATQSNSQLSRKNEEIINKILPEQHHRAAPDHLQESPI